MKALVLMTWLGLVGAPKQVVNFDAGPSGGAPSGWTMVEPHRHAETRWEIRKDQSAPTPPFVLAPVAASSGADRFPLAVLDNMSLRDGDISVRMKLVAGQSEQAAGLVFRYRDPGNFYLARANALDNSVGVYKVVDGKYHRLRDVHRVLPRNFWSVFKVSLRGPRFSVYVNHRRIVQADDATFKVPGQVGLWTRGDTVVYFDDFRASAR